MSSLHHENILEDCFEVAMESFRINNKLRNIFVSASIIEDRDIFAMYILYKIQNIFISTYFLIWVAFRL